MSEPIVILDLSHWQGSNIDWRKMKAARVQGVQIKLTQGATHKDPLAASHYAGALSVGILPGGYHFTTHDPAQQQADNYLSTKAAIGDKWVLPDWQDCEAYASYGREEMSARELKTYVYQNDRVKFHETDYALTVVRMPAIAETCTGYADTGEVYTLSYPTSAAVDVIGRKLNAYARSAIYTNPASGNKIFGKQIVFGQRYFLSLAHWYTNKPTNPAAWQGKPLLNWQRGVVDGRKYGIPGQVDYNEWQNALEFPGAVEPEPEPDEDFLDCKVTTNLGVYSGRLARVTNAEQVTSDETLCKCAICKRMFRANADRSICDSCLDW